MTVDLESLYTLLHWIKRLRCGCQGRLLRARRERLDHNVKQGLIIGENTILSRPMDSRVSIRPTVLHIRVP
jgi:hypothetical protein